MDFRHASSDDSLIGVWGKALKEIGETLNLSIPVATNKRREMEAACRFGDNAKVTPESQVSFRTSTEIVVSEVRVMRSIVPPTDKAGRSSPSTGKTSFKTLP